MNTQFSAKWASGFFRSKGLEKTAGWIDFALTTPMPDLWTDLTDIISAMRIDIRGYRREYYNDPKFKEKCFDMILERAR